MAADMSKMTCGGGLSLGGATLCVGAADGAGASDAGGAGASVLGRLSIGGGGALEGSASDDPPGSPMATDRRISGGSACSPQVQQEDRISTEARKSNLAQSLACVLHSLMLGGMSKSCSWLAPMQRPSLNWLVIASAAKY